MLPHVVAARHVHDHVLWLRFDDGVEGEIDLVHELRGPIFEPLRNPDYFTRFEIHPELRTLVWPNGADFAPEFLHGAIRSGQAPRSITRHGEPRAIRKT